MVRRRAPVRRRASRARTVYRRARSPQLNVTNIALGSAVVAVGEPILDSYLARYTGGQGTMLANGAKVGVGYFVAKKMRSPIAKAAGMALMVIGIRNIVRPLAGNLIGAPAQSNAGFVPTMI